MSARSLGALALACVALLLVALFDPWLGTPGDPGGRILDPTLETTLSQLIVHRGSTRYQLAREAGVWRIEEPVPAPARTASVRKLVEAMLLLRSLRQGEIEKVGTPDLVVEYKSASGDGELVIGSVGADGRHRWLRQSGGSKAQLVQAHLVDEMLAASSQLVSERVLPFEIHHQDLLRLAFGSSWIQLQGESVSMAGAELPMPMGDKARAFLTLLRTLSFHSVEIGGGTCEPSEVLQIGHEGQEAILRACGHCDDALVAIEVGQRRGCLDARAWQDLLGVVTEPSSIVDLLLLPARPQDFSLQCGNERLDVIPTRVDSGRLLSWWTEINASVQSLVPRREIAVRCTLTIGEQKIDFGTIENEWFAAIEGQGLMRLLEQGAASLLKASTLRFASLSLISADPLFARRIAFAGPSQAGWVLEREQMAGPWHDPQKLIPEDRATELAEALVSELATLRATSYLEIKEGAIALPRPAMRIELVFDSALGGPDQDFEVQLARVEGGCQASVNGGPVAVLAPDLCDRLWRVLEL